MAVKLSLLKLFNTGQGILGGKSKYVNYPSDLDTNFDSIEKSVNQLIDEVNVARLPNASITTDLLLDAAIVTQGRYRQDSATITRTDADTITIGSGLIYAGGARINVVGQAIEFNGLTNGTYYIATDENGVLFNSTTVNNRAFDIATVVWDGGLLDTDITDNLFNGGRTLGSTNSGAMQEHFISPDEEAAITSSNYPGRQAPTVRYMDNAGTFGDSGIFAGDTDEWWGVSQRVTSPGVGNTVLAWLFSPRAQLQLFEQARLMLTYSSGSAGNGTLAALTMAQSRQEPTSYGSGTLWGSGALSTFNVPNDTQYEGTYLITGFIEFNASATDEVAAQVTVGGSVAAYGRQAVGGSSAPVVSFSGLVDASANDAVQVLAEATTNLTIASAQMGMILVGGRATA